MLKKNISLILAFFLVVFLLISNNVVKATPSITFSNYSHVVEHKTTKTKILFTDLVGSIVGVSITTPQAHSVITNLAVNGSNIEFNTRGKSGTEHILVNILDSGTTKAVQLFIQVIQASVADFSTAISTTFLSVDTYNTRGSVVGDLDGDGNLDIAIAVDGGVNYWYKNDGSGIFTKKSSFGGLYNSSTDIGIGDLDSDGNLDLFIVNNGQNDYIYLNNGSGVFAQKRISTRGTGTGVSLGDIDNDGDLDAYVSNNNQQNKLWLNDGNAIFTANDISGDTGRSSSADLGDVDNDGDLDIYVANFVQQNKLWLNDGSANFTAGTISHGSRNSIKVKFADLNNDGDLDLYIGNSTQQNQIYLGDGLGGFTTNKNITNDFGVSEDIAISDINKDGLLDIYVIDDGLQNKLWLGTGGADFINSDIAGDSGSTLSNNIADFNNDGILDLFVGNGNQQDKLYLSKEVVISATPSIVITPGTSKNIPISFNNFYPTTLKSSSTGKITYSLSTVQNIKKGTSVRATINVAINAPAGQATLSLYLAGVTKNIIINIAEKATLTFAKYNYIIEHKVGKKQKIAIANISGTTTIKSYGEVIKKLAINGSQLEFETVGLGKQRVLIQATELSDDNEQVQLSFQVIPASNTNFSTVLKVSDISNNTYDIRDKNAVYGDIDNDGDLDIIIPINNNKANVIYKNNGDGTFIGANFGASKSTHYIEVGDLDGDGDLDLLVANHQNQNNYYYINDGSGSFTANQFSATQNSQELAIGDIDNDGDLDGYFINWGGKNALQINDGNANFTSKEISSDSKDSYSVDFGDVDNDGDLDIYVGNNGQENELLINNGNLSFSSILMGSSSSRGDHGGNDTTKVKFSDLNNDNNLDLYIANYNQQNQIYLGDGLGNFTTNKNITNDVGNSTGVDISDINKDGLLDIYVTSYNQQNKLWLGIGGTDFIANDIDGDTNSKGSVIADFNGDGALDIFSNKQNQKNKLYLSQITKHDIFLSQNNINMFANDVATVTIKLNSQIIPALSLLNLNTQLQGSVSIVSISKDSHISFEDTPIIILRALKGVVTGETATVKLFISGASATININFLTSSKPSITLKEVFLSNGIAREVKLDYRKSGSSTTISIASVSNPHVIVSIKEVNDTNFILEFPKLAPFVGTANIILSAKNSTGIRIVTLTVDVIRKVTITFAKYNYIVEHKAGQKQKIAIKNISGNTVIKTYGEVIKKLAVNGSQLEFETVGLGKQRVLIQATELSNDNEQVQLFIQVIPASNTNFNTVLIASDISNNTYNIRNKNAVYGDVDNDGDLDIIIPVHGAANVLYKNNGDGTFVDTRFGASKNTHYIDVGDLDSDGDLDLLVANRGNQNNYYYLNNGYGLFTAHKFSATQDTHEVIMGDIDNDGDLDGYFVNWGGKNALQINDGNANFTSKEISTDIKQSYSVDFGDVDNDGDLDIYVGNNGQENELLINNGNLSFSSILMGSSSSRGDHGGNDTTKVKFADLNNDNNLDLYIANYNQQNQIYLGDGLGNFTTNKNITNDVGNSTGVDISDINKDGLLDIYVTSYNQQNKLWLGTGGTDFIANDIYDDRNSKGAIIADFDNDGALDIFSNKQNQKNKLYLSRITKPNISLSQNNINMFADDLVTITIKLNFKTIPVLSLLKLNTQAQGSVSIVSISKNSNINFADTPIIVVKALKGVVTGETATVKLFISGASKSININFLTSSKPSITLKEVFVSNEGTQEVKLDYSKNGSSTTIKIASVSKSQVTVSIKEVNNDNFILSFPRLSPFVGTANIILSAKNSTGIRIVTLTVNVIKKATITFAKYNYIVEHKAGQKQKIAIKNISGNTVIKTYGEVIKKLALNDSQLEFETVGLGKQRVLIQTTGGSNNNEQVQIFFQVIPALDTNFGTFLTVSDVSNNAYNIRDKNVAYGDIDNDGDLDIIIPVHGAANVLYKNNGDGTFVDTRFGVSKNTHYIDVGDLDSDGDLDLLVANRGNQNNYYYLNNGYGLFTAHKFSATQDTHEVIMGDIDNDGDLDGYFVNWNQRNVLQINDGNANFTSQEISTDIKQSYSVDLGDVDNDGDLDIYVGNNGQANELLINNDNISFSSIVMNSSSSRGDHGSDNTLKVKFVDINNDNNLDLYIANYNQQNQIYLGDGLGNFTTNKNITNDVGNSTGVDISDINKDGLLDIYVTSYNQQNKLWLGIGGTDFIANDIDGDTDSKGAIIADFNNDGVLDIFSNKQNQKNKLYLSRITKPNISLSQNNINMFADDLVTITIKLNFKTIPVLSLLKLNTQAQGSVSIVSISKNSNINFADTPIIVVKALKGVVTGETATVKLFISGASKSININFLTSSKPSITLKEVFVSNEGTQEVKLDYSKNGSSTTIKIASVSKSQVTVSIKEVNNDNFILSFPRLSPFVGTANIILSAKNSTGIRIVTLTVNVIKKATITFAKYNYIVEHKAGQKQKIAIKNISGNAVIKTYGEVIKKLAINVSQLEFETVGLGKQRVLIQTTGGSNNNEQVQIFFQVIPALDTNFGTVLTVSDISNNTYNIRNKNAVYGDVDNDGDLDIIIPVHGAANVLYKNNGDGTFVDTRFGASKNTHYIDVGDLDSDGDLDLLVANRGNQNNYYYLNNGYGLFTAHKFSATQDTHEVIMGDIDNDGDLDGYFVNWNQKNVLQINDGNANFTSKEISIDSKNSFSVDIGDVDNDGDLDIYVGNNGQANELLINNGNISFSSIVMNSSSSRGDHGGNDTAKVKFSDLNNDNNLDLYIANYNQQNQIYLGDGLGNFTTNKNITNDVGNSTGVDISDFNKDGLLDIYVTSYNQQNKLWLGIGGTDFIANDIDGDTDSKGAIIADFNGDGALDIFSNKQNQKK